MFGVHLADHAAGGLEADLVGGLGGQFHPAHPFGAAVHGDLHALGGVLRLAVEDTAVLAEPGPVRIERPAAAHGALVVAVVDAQLHQQVEHALLVRSAVLGLVEQLIHVVEGLQDGFHEMDVRIAEGLGPRVKVLHVEAGDLDHGGGVCW